MTIYVFLKDRVNAVNDYISIKQYHDMTIFPLYQWTCVSFLWGYVLINDVTAETKKYNTQ